MTPPLPSHASPAGQVTIVCLAVGDLYGMADLYIARLFDMLGRHCPRPFRLVCYTDRPRRVPSQIVQRDCAAWTELEREGMRPTTRKLGLFNPAYAEFEEFLYLDLTLVVRKDMGPLLDFAFGRPEDLVILRDWHYDGYNSSVMRIRRGALRWVYEAFVAGTRFDQRIPGDQDFLHQAIVRRSLQHRVALFPPGLVASFRQVRRSRDPDFVRRSVASATIVKFHGDPKMHDAFELRYRLRRRVRELLHGHLLPVVPLGELRRHWLGKGVPR